MQEQHLYCSALLCTLKALTTSKTYPWACITAFAMLEAQASYQAIPSSPAQQPKHSILTRNLLICFISTNRLFNADLGHLIASLTTATGRSTGVSRCFRSSDCQSQDSFGTINRCFNAVSGHLISNFSTQSTSPSEAGCAEMMQRATWLKADVPASLKLEVQMEEHGF